MIRHIFLTFPETQENDNDDIETVNKNNDGLKLTPTIITFGCLINCAAGAGLKQEAIKMYSRMKLEFGIIDPTGFCGMSAMSACAVDGDYKSALKLLGMLNIQIYSLLTYFMCLYIDIQSCMHMCLDCIFLCLIITYRNYQR